MLAAQIIATALAIYALIGVLFAVWFVAFAVDRFDPAARGTGKAFRAVIFPGAAALWPVLLGHWMKGRPTHD